MRSERGQAQHLCAHDHRHDGRFCDRDGRRIRLVRQAPAAVRGRLRRARGRTGSSEHLPATARAQEFADKNTPNNLGTVNYAISTKCTASAGTCAINNAVVVKATAIVPTWFARIPPFNIDNWNLRARAVAAHDTQNQQYDIVLAIDRTGSMCSPTGAGGFCTDLNNAKSGIRTLLGLMNAATDQIGMVAFPPLGGPGTPVCDTPVDYDGANRKYLSDPLNMSYQNANKSLNSSSGLYQHTVAGTSWACMQSAGSTSYSFGLGRPRRSSTRRAGERPEDHHLHDRRRGQPRPRLQTDYKPNHAENLQPCAGRSGRPRRSRPTASPSTRSATT